jgi:magnesium chelatase family protein
MSLAIVYSRAQAGIDAPLVTVEVHISNGLPALAIVGLPETAVKESRERVRGALLNSGFEFPPRRITVNLAPADLPKEGGRYDLAIALGILAASGQLEARALAAHEFIGELALTGELRAVLGALPAVLRTRQAERCLVVPMANTGETALLADAPALGAAHLLAVCAHLEGREKLPRAQATAASPSDAPAVPDMGEIHAQHHAKRALEVAAAGGHNLLMIGPPGAGKTSLAVRFPGILPAMTDEEALESAVVHSLGHGGLDAAHWRRRPFRAPHHTASAIALAGGGSVPQAGEISLAHHGVLFLDELPEFGRRALEVLREPMESGRITIARARRRVEFPARFQLLAAMNPCPCGHLGTPGGRCRCNAEQIARYRARLSGPLLDRIDMHVEVPPVPYAALRRAAQQAAPSDGNSESARMRERVSRVRRRQLERDGKPAQLLGPRETELACRLDAAGAALLEQAAERFGFSARSHHRILRLARTIADLDEAAYIDRAHLGEAIGYRTLDRAPPA